MALDVAALRAGVILELAPGGIERVAHRDLQVLVVLAGDGDFSTGNLEVDAHRELPAAALVARADA
jgi:hypothetical protein